MRIIAGTHRGRHIPFNNRRFGNARVTSDFVKEAVFGSLGVELGGVRLLDPFAGSGQIGLEAVSRGATVWLNDRDRKRAAFIRSVVDEWELADSVTLTTEDALKLIARLGASGETFDVVYVDPPYDAQTRAGDPLSQASLEALATSGCLAPDARIFVQHDRRTSLPEAIGNLTCQRSRRYGDSLLSRYE